MTTILQITPSYKPAYIYGGTTFSVSKLCEEIQKDNYQVKVLTTTANGKFELPVETHKVSLVEKVEVNYFKRLSKDHTHFSPALLLHLVKLIKQHKRSNTGNLIVHIHSWWNTVAVFSCLISWWHKIPVVLSPRGMLTPYTLHNRNATYKSLIHHLLGKYLLKNCHIHATSIKEELDIRKIQTSIKSSHVLPNFVNYPSNKIPANLEGILLKEGINFLFLSRIEEKKGLDILFTALSSLDFNWQLTIAGTGEADYIHQLQRLSEQLKINHFITWIGEVKNNKKFDLIRNNDLLILPSHNENFANVVIESLSMGTPVIITKGVGLAAYVLQKNLGWITDLEPACLALAINRAVTDQRKRIWIRNQAPQMIKDDFSPEKLRIKYSLMYSQILKNVN